MVGLPWYGMSCLLYFALVMAAPQSLVLSGIISPAFLFGLLFRAASSRISIRGFLSFLMKVADGLIQTLDEWLSRAEGRKTFFKRGSCTGPKQWL